jgi:hypothetical protein
MLTGVTSGVDVLTGKTFDLRSTLTLPPRASVILELDALELETPR